VGRLRLADHMSRAHTRHQHQHLDTMATCQQCGKVVAVRPFPASSTVVNVPGLTCDSIRKKNLLLSLLPGGGGGMVIGVRKGDKIHKKNLERRQLEQGKIEAERNK
jgi:hypothetical protein